jgi:hypothetical protein
MVWDMLVPASSWYADFPANTTPNPGLVALLQDQHNNDSGADLWSNDADLAEPFGVLDLGDLNAFVVGFTAQDPIADIDANGTFDLGDINAFKLQPANPVPLEGFGRVIDLSEEYLVVGRNRSQRVEIYDPSNRCPAPDHQFKHPGIRQRCRDRR